MSASSSPSCSADAGTASSGAPYPWVQAGVTLAVALLIAGIRRPAAWFNAQFWAEDGSVFFTQAASLGTQALTLPHAGYQHLLPRIVAHVTEPLPLAWMPTLFVLATVLVWSGVVLFLFSPRVGLRWPIAMVAVLVLLPADNEIWFNLTNVQWTTALLIPLWLGAQDPKSWRGVAGEGIAVGLVGLTGVFSVVAAPLFVIKAMIRRSVAAGVLAGAWVLVGAAQWLTVRAEGASQAGGLPMIQSAVILGKRVLGTLFLPAGVSDGLTVGLGLGLAFAGLGWMSWRTWRTATLRPCWYGVGFAILVGGATLWRFKTNLDDLMPTANGERYFFVPKVLVGWGLIQLAAQPTRDRWVALAALVVALGVALPKFKLPPLTDHDWPRWAERIEAGERGWVPITPEGFRFIPPERRKEDS